MTDKVSLNRPPHDPLPVEKCPYCFYESPHHKEAGWVIKDFGGPRMPYYICANEVCQKMFEGKISKEELENAGLS
jgi:hypothetical protein